MPGQVVLVDPLAVIDGRKALFLRDNFGGEVPLSCAYPPLELAFTASVLRRAGIPVDLIAANVLGLHHAALAERLRADPPQMVVVPSAWGSLIDDFRLMAILREALPDTRLVLYGANMTADPERPLRSSEVDIVILGEPEEAVLALAGGDEPLEEIPNIAFLRDGELVCTSRRLPLGWPTYPLPARDLLDLSRYTIPFSRRIPVTTISTTRGCPKKCTFCPTQIWNKREVRARPVPLVLEEIDELVLRYGMREVSFRDDTFTWDRDRVVEICRGLLRRGHDLTWRCFATVDTVDAELLSLMARAGCVQVCYGFESGDDAILRKTGKATTVAQGRDAVRLAQAAGIEVSGTFIVGLEGETRESVERSIAFAKECDLDYVQVNVAVPMPTTGFGRRHSRRGLDSRPERFRWSGAETSETEAMGAAELSRTVRRFYRSFYLRPQYILGRLTSRRGFRSLLSHARLGIKMLAHVTVPAMRSSRRA